MKSEELYETIEGIDEKYITEAETVSGKRGLPLWVKLTAAAAGLILLITGAISLNLSRKEDSSINKWSKDYAASDYFANSYKGEQPNNNSSASLVMPPYAVSVLINDRRSELENAGILPVMPGHADNSFEVAFNGDGSLYKASFLWMSRVEQGMAEYSDLQLIVSPKELHEISDMIMIVLDEQGNVIPEDETVTLRDGILIYARGREDAVKAISWQTELGCYKITGSSYDSYEDMVALLDWFWEHPLRISYFENVKENHFVYSNRTENPDAFKEQIPNFAALGYKAVSEKVNFEMQGGSLLPVWFEGVYTKGNVKITWTVSAGADADSWGVCIGSLSSLSEEKVIDSFSRTETANIYLGSHYMAGLKAENARAEDAWEIICSLKKLY